MSFEIYGPIYESAKLFCVLFQDIKFHLRLQKLAVCVYTMYVPVLLYQLQWPDGKNMTFMNKWVMIIYVWNETK